MPHPRIRKDDVWQGVDYTFRERVVRDGGVALVEADVTSWSLRMFERDDDRDGKWIVRDSAPAGFVFDTLSTDGWTEDTVGWNFKYRLAYTTFKAQARRYRFEFSFTTASYGPIRTVWSVNYLPMGSV